MQTSFDWIPATTFFWFVLIAIFGILTLIIIAYQQREKSRTLDGFFLGGRNIGANLSGQISWGSSFSLANGLAYFAYLGYFHGLSAIWFQVPWCMSIWFMAWHLPRYLKATDRFTVHSFLGSYFGDPVRKLAAVVTIFGFLGFLAYELNISSEIVLSSVGAMHSPNAQTSIILMSIIGALLVAIFCDLSGYRGVATTDRFENIFGAIACLIFVILIYLYAPLDAIRLSPDNIISSLMDFSSWSGPTIAGILCFASTQNLVDMSRWQTLSANGAATTEQRQKLSRKLKWSAAWTLLLPGIVGTVFGYLAKGSNIAGNEAIAFLFNRTQAVFPGHGGGILFGLIIFGLFCTAFSTAKNYLIAVCQALRWDILDFSAVERLRDSTLDHLEDTIVVRKARRDLYYLVFAGISAFMAIRYFMHDDNTVFATQFLIAGAVTSLVPTTMYALFFKLDLPGRPDPFEQWTGFISIASGYVGGLVVFGWWLWINQELNTYAWGPIVSLGLSLLTLLVMVMGRRLSSSSKNMIGTSEGT
jgi:Na+/proline symporter